MIVSNLQNQDSSDNTSVGAVFVDRICNDLVLKTCLLIIVLSYFYNLPIIKYAAVGSNEFRIYDVFGVVVIYYYFSYSNFVMFVIRRISVFNWMRMLLNWAVLTLPVSLFFFVFFGDTMSFVQTLLYLYHFYVFFISSVFIFIFCFKKSNIILFSNAAMIFSILACSIVILQNFNVIPFLWGQVYKLAYHGFLSGTLGPNKIVLGMTSFFIFAFCVAIYL
jgi:hypothetical protein